MTRRGRQPAWRGPSTIGTASQVTNCGDPTLLKAMSAATRPSASGGTRSPGATPRRTASTPSTAMPSTATTSAGVVAAAIASTPSPET